MSQSAVLVAPTLGTPLSGTLTNATGLPASGVVGTAAILGANTFTGLQTLNGNLTISGNQTSAAWTSTGISIVQAAANYTDTSSSGTVPLMYISRLGVPTVIASSVTTYTNAYNLYIEAPVAGTNVTFTNRYALGLNGGLNFVSGFINSNFLVANAVGQGYFAPNTNGLFGFNFTNNVYIAGSTMLGWVSNGPSMTTGTFDTMMGRRSAANLSFGGADAASPISQTLSTQGARAGTDNNTSGANLTIQPGVGTGTGTPSSLILNGVIGTASGSGAQITTSAITVAGALSGQVPNVVIGSNAISSTATDGFLYIPTCAGAPTGTPTTFAGRIPMIYDTTNDQFWFYRGGWKQPKTPAGAAIVTWQ